MAETVKKQIDGNDYEIAPFLGMHGWRLQMRLGKMLGPSIKAVIGGLPAGQVASIMQANVDPAMIGNGVAAFIDALTENDPDGKLVEQLLSQTQRNGVLLSQHEINKVFAANYGEMMKAVIAVVVANGFFGLSATGLDMVQGLMAHQSPAS